MDVLSLKIASHNLTIAGSPEAEVIRSIAGFPVFVCEGEKEWEILFGEDVGVPLDAKLLTRFPFDEGHVECSYLRRGEERFFVMTPKSGEPLTMRYCMGENTVSATHSDNPDMLRFGCWFAFCWLAGRHHVVPIHSSTIEYRGKAVLFLGESGTGKSTHTSLWLNHIEGARLLNDDSPMLSLEGDVPVVYGSPWSGKTPCFHAEQYPLAAVVRLSQAPENKMRRLSTIASFAAVHPSLPPAQTLDDYYADLWVEVVSRVLAAAPVYHLACLPDEEAARLSFSTIFHER